MSSRSSASTGAARSPSGQRLGRLPAEADQPEAEGEPAGRVAPEQPVGLERDGQPVDGGPENPVAPTSSASVDGPPLGDRVEHRHRLVEDADAAYSLFHESRL